MTMLNQLYQLQLVSGQTRAGSRAGRSADGAAGDVHGTCPQRTRWLTELVRTAPLLVGNDTETRATVLNCRKN